jgi:hypothetical protein
MVIAFHSLKRRLSVCGYPFKLAVASASGNQSRPQARRITPVL